jgi:allantoinase
MTDLIVRGARVVLPDGMRAAAIHVRDGRIAAVRPFADCPPGVPAVDAGDHVVLPGLVDTHVHINDPGRTAWEGFEHATRAAAAGGVTTLVDMPLNSIPPATTANGLAAKRHAARGRCHVDVGAWGGVVPGNAGELDGLARAGVRGFKCFLCPSGVDEFAHVAEPDLREALPVVAALGLPLLVHAESPERLPQPVASHDEDPRAYATWLDSRPPEAEHAAIALLVRLAREYDARVHIVHLSSADALPLIRAAREAGVAVTVETCPHYLTFAAEDIAAGATAFKCAPPIRARDQRERLWQGLAAGDIDLVATDHSPAPAALKHLDTGDFVRAWGGISSLQIGLPAVWTGARTRGLSLEDVVRWTAAAPARLAGLAGAKGAIAAGCDADLVLWDPEAESIVDATRLHHRHAVTPYAGMRLRGRVTATLLAGAFIYRDGEIVGAPRGRWIGPA